MINIYNVLIFGTGSTTKCLLQNLNSEVNILNYLDNDENRWGKELGKIKILDPVEVNKLKYDYVIIASQFNNDIYNQLIKYEVDSSKIFEYLDFLKFMNNPFEAKIKNFEKNKSEYETIITGISYFVSGISGEFLTKRGINFAFDSQDLYYDYNITKYILENYENRIKYTIIGLNYYSFEYDLSLSSMKNNIGLYYPILKKSHNSKISFVEKDRLIVNKNIADKILNLNDDGVYDLKNKFEALIYQEDLFEKGKKQALLDCNKNYPKTVRENTAIFSEYLGLLKKHNIKPIVVICPTSKYYYKNFSERIKNEFLKLINEMKCKYDFQYIDYFESDLFDDSMFYDVSHLTFEGGKKFTQILNDVIEW